MVSGVGRGMGVLDEGGDRRREGQFWGQMWASHSITNGNSVAQLFSAVWGGDAARPKLLWDFLLL